MHCAVCLYDCYTCNDATSCATCSATLDFRAINTGTQRCDPILGYWNNLTSSTAIPCDTSCLGCITDAITCTSCQPGKYITGSVCSPCLLNCISCTTVTDCSNCITSYIFNSSAGACQSDCTSINKCTACVVNPDSSMQCTACLSDYILSGSICVTNCGDGVITTDEACDDNNII
jgi:proprotein convertase subtilisin/kexin type 5